MAASHPPPQRIGPSERVTHRHGKGNHGSWPSTSKAGLTIAMGQPPAEHASPRPPRQATHQHSTADYRSGEHPTHRRSPAKKDSTSGTQTKRGEGRQPSTTSDNKQ